MIFMIIIWILVPFCVSAIYNYFYTQHINKQMNQTKKKTWITPISVFFITLSLEFLVFLILVVLLSANPNTTYVETPIHMYNYSMYNETEINKSIYSVFDGNEVNGYIKKVGSYKNFNYILYTCQYTLNTSPSYVLITDYVGNKDYLKEETTIIITAKTRDNSVSNTDITGITQNSNRVYYIIDPGEFQIIDIKMYLLDKEQNMEGYEDYDDFMDEVKGIEKIAIEEFTFTIKEISQ